MQVYKINFVNSEILSVKEVNGRLFDGSYYIEHHNTNLIFALVKAGDETEARKKAEEILSSFKKNKLGSGGQ